MILITGGLGYIGSHVAALFADQGTRELVLLDNLHNSNISILTTLRDMYPQTLFHFYEADIRDAATLDTVFRTHAITTVIHMAALKAVAESFTKRAEYEAVNVGGTETLLAVMETAGCRNIVFSSSATVYGTASGLLTEAAQAGQGITNPYGETKWAVEQLLQSKAPTVRSVILRYFNPVGAHASHKLGENPNGIPNNLFPVLLRSLRTNTPLTIHGSDYPTRDGTCIRDYVDIQDLAKAHAAAVERIECLTADENPFVCNIGTGRGTSVLEMVACFKNTTGVQIPYTLGPRRSGDLAQLVATIDTTRIAKLGWSPSCSIQESCRNAWFFHIHKL